MDNYVCIHGHFYQPPRENPWLEEVEMQDGAYPYHDWNEKITDECYRQNAASRILGPDKKIIDIVNNYQGISFDFGPTLLSWLERHAPDVYQSVLDADKISRDIFSGHGSAIAHAYNHIIMPLANSRDKRTQVVWGIYDFEQRFGRKPEGMWLPETAADLETLDILAEHNIKFTILSPHQARRVRKIGDGHWKNVERDKFDTTQPYLCKLPSGRSINLFFYHGATAEEIINGRLLQDGETFAKRMAWIFSLHQNEHQLAHIAADGETYGHHHRYADMALAYCLHYIKSKNLAKITVYGEYLEKFPPAYEIDIYENSSWSCVHGVERWKSNCGCCSASRFPCGQQQWRSPLREAMDWLRDNLINVYQSRMAALASDPWLIRDKYIEVINDRSPENIQRFILAASQKQLSPEDQVTFLKLLELQRNALLMYTSCGWFFDDIAGIETIQILQYASRAIQLAKEIDNKDFEPDFENILQKANCNAREYANGKEAYDALAKSASVDLNRVAVHFAISSIFSDYPQEETDIFCYSAKADLYDRVDAGIQILATGRTTVRSNIVLETYTVDFAVLYLGDHNLIGSAIGRMPEKSFTAMQQHLKDAFRKGDVIETMRLMSVIFKGNNYSLWHLFRDEQRRILYELLETTWKEIDASFRHLYEHNYSIMQVMRSMNVPLPKALAAPVEFIINNDLCQVIREEKISLERLQSLVSEATVLNIQLDLPTLQFEVSRKITCLMLKFQQAPENIELLESIEATFRILFSIVSQFNPQTAQNVLFAISKKTYPEMNKRASQGDENAKKWVENFKNLTSYLGVLVQ